VPLTALLSRCVRLPVVARVQRLQKLRINADQRSMTEVVRRHSPARRHTRMNPKEGDMAYIIAESCIGVKDASCVAVCPVDCIYEGEDMYYINPDECIDCGACEPECPVTAIFADDSVPEQWQGFIAKNRVFFGL
jgi:ferredoxin